MRELGPDGSSVVRPTRDLLLNFFYPGNQLFILLSPYPIFVFSPFHISISIY